jgi:putative membrane protein
MPVCGPWFGFWFIFPIIGLVMMIVVLFLVFWPRGPFAHFGPRGSWGGPSGGSATAGESALDILKRRYARGEITREQFDQIRRDVS